MSLDKRKPLKMIDDDLEYFDHQLAGIRQMRIMSGALLADEMGLGKTIQALTVAAIAWETGESNRFLVVAPASLKGVWGDEIEQFTRFTYEILPSNKPPAKREAMIRGFDKNVLIVNYEQVEKHIDLLNELRSGIVIYDEAHMLKNRKSKRTKACFKLAVPRHFLLTGSPMLNQVDDLWALLHRIDPHEFQNYWTFVNRYALFGGWGGKEIIGVKNEAELRERLQRYMIRRTKKECLDLPDKQYITIKLDLHPEQERLYKQAVEEMRIDNPAGASPFEIQNELTKFLRLKQICGTTATIPGHDDHSTKLDRVVEMVEEIIGNGEPVVLFTQFRGVLEALDNRLRSAGFKPFVLHGDVPIGTRSGLIADWTTASRLNNHQPLICMYQVGGVGLTMTAASKVILLDKLFVPKLNEQAVDRLHRIGQTETVQVYQLLMRKTIETRIERIIRMKNSVFGAVVDTKDSTWKRKLLIALAESEEEEE